MAQLADAVATPPRTWRGWVSLIARLILGGVMFYGGATKVGNLELSVRSVRNYQLPLPDWAELVIGYALPIAELILGLLLILGLFTRLSSLAVTLLLIVFIIGIASAWARGLRIDCGCFAPGDVLGPEEDPKYLQEIIRDLALVAMGVWLVWRPQSPLSVDRWLFSIPKNTTDSQA